MRLLATLAAPMAAMTFLAAGAAHAQTPQPSAPPQLNAGPSANALAGKAFLEKNAKEAGVVTLPQGLQYKVVREGPQGGLHPTQADEVKVHYEGKLLDGTVFDSSYERGVPAVFPLDGLVPAWVIALQRMKAGDEWILYVPPALGYGAQDKGEIPPDSVLVFRLQLLGMLEVD
jgi:FKBP-type peptidyl-prolyl cis-trans isomerase FklB